MGYRLCESAETSANKGVVNGRSLGYNDFLTSTRYTKVSVDSVKYYIYHDADTLIRPEHHKERSFFSS